MRWTIDIINRTEVFYIHLRFIIFMYGPFIISCPIPYLESTRPIDSSTRIEKSVSWLLYALRASIQPIRG